MKKIIVLLLGLFCFVPLATKAIEKDDSWVLVDRSVVYYKTTNINGLELNEEITEEEFNNADVNENRNLYVSPNSYVETSYKRLDLAVSNNSSVYLAELHLTWKGVPKTRSFDVIAMRGQGMSLVKDSESGAQYYFKGDTRNVVNYVYNGTNILIDGSTGYGISMNLVNDTDITGFQMVTRAFFTKAVSGTAKIFGTYQHATEDVTLAQSKNYTINPNGLGGVIYFLDRNIDTKYDQMNGAYVNI